MDETLKPAGLMQRANQLIATLELKAHPEGGYFRRIITSQEMVSPHDGRSDRRALTSIFFLLPRGQVSRFHRVMSDETWHYHEGDPIDLLRVSPDLSQSAVHRIGPASDDMLPVAHVPAGWWQAALPTGTYCFMSCCVGPGFEFEDFTLLAEHTEACDAVTRQFPQWREFI